MKITTIILESIFSNLCGKKLNNITIAILFANEYAAFDRFLFNHLTILAYFASYSKTCANTRPAL